MKRYYDYTAKGADGTGKFGVVTADNESAAVQSLKKSGLTVRSVYPMRDFLGVRAYYYKLKNNISKRAIQEFFELLSYMLDTGIPLHNALLMLRGIGANKKIQQLAKPLTEQVIQEGSQLSEALDTSGQFRTSIVRQIKSGEESNSVPEALDRISDSLTRELEFQGKIKNAMIYPCMVIMVMVVVLWALMTMVVPALSQTLENLGGELPWITKKVVDVSNFLLVGTPYIVLAVAALVIGYKTAHKTIEVFGYEVDKRKTQIPIAGPLIEKIEMSKFCRSLSAMLDCGTPLYRAMQIAQSTVSNKYLRKKVERAAYLVEVKGSSLSAALANAKGFPLMMVQFLEIAVSSGKVAEVLEKLAQRYERDIDNTVKRLTTMIEPLLIVFVAVIVGTVVIAMYLPILSISDSIL